jgi:serine/threonine protein kinase
VSIDLQAANILITNSGVCKLADFGVATSVASHSMMSSNDEDAFDVAGSPFWSMSCTIDSAISHTESPLLKSYRYGVVAQQQWHLKCLKEKCRVQQRISGVSAVP